MANSEITKQSSCSESEPFALQVLGDSMEPEFPDGCIITIEPSGQCASGMFIMCMVEDTRLFRQYIKDDEGERLIALNDMYPEIYLDGLSWKIEGVIMQRVLRRKQSSTGKRESKHYSYK